MAGLDRKSFLLGLGTSTLGLAPTSALAQIMNPAAILRRAQVQAKSRVENLAEEAIVRALFPIETTESLFLRQLPNYDTTNFGQLRPLNQLLRTPTGGFKLRPGAWFFEAQSYCLKAGTYERTGGAGYRAGPMDGKLGPTVLAILQASYAHPEVSQRDIQKLLWSILAGITINELQPTQRATAEILLSPNQIEQAQLAMQEIPREISAAVMARLPRPVRELVVTRQRLRAAMSRTSVNYTELERIAVLTGLPPLSGDETPAGRWSWNPQGYLIRYFSESYSKTRVEIIVPDRITLRRDAKRRITQLALADGRRVDVTYRDDLGPVRFRALPNMSLHFFQTVRYTFPNTFPNSGPGARGPKVITVTDKGYTFLSDGYRRGGGRRSSLDVVSQKIGHCQSPEDDIFDGVSEDARDHAIANGIEASGSRGLAALNEARARQEAIEGLVSTGTPAATIDNLGDAEHMREGVTSVVIGDTSDRLDFISEFQESLIRALAGANATLDSMTGTASTPAPASGVSYEVVFDPPSSAAYPTGSGQRRGMSGLPSSR